VNKSIEHERDNVPYAYHLVNGPNLNATEMLASILDTDKHVVQNIPKGFKDNVYFMFDNSNNISMRQNSKHSTFADDCGSWDTHSGRTNKTDFLLMPDNTLKWTIKQGEVYYYQTKSKGKKAHKAYNPQPDQVITIHRYYTSLKRDKSYNKRVNWFSNLPQQFASRNHIAIVEYTGLFPREGKPHGNSKHTSQEYIRTDPKIIHQIKEGIDQRQSNTEIYKNMVFEDPENAPRDYHQIRNVKHVQKKQRKSTSFGNVADEIIDIFSMVNKDTFVKEVVYTQGNNKPPSVICYTDDQLKDLQQFLKSDKVHILGVDRTFNLGAIFVTNFVYKNTKVTSKESGDHPIFVGPLFLHRDG
jgi:hypothetical protein